MASVCAQKLRYAEIVILCLLDPFGRRSKEMESADAKKNRTHGHGNNGKRL